MQFHKVINNYHFNFTTFDSDSYYYKRIKRYVSFELDNCVCISIYSICCKEPEELIIPRTVEHEGVVYNVIAIYNISDLSYVKKIFVPNSIVHINYITHNKSLEHIEFEKGGELLMIDFYGSSVFCSNDKLKNIIFPNSLKLFSLDNFAQCYNLEYIYIPGTCIIKDENGFYDYYHDDFFVKNCPNLKYIIWGNIIIEQYIINKNKFYYKIKEIIDK